MKMFLCTLCGIIFTFSVVLVLSTIDNREQMLQSVQKQTVAELEPVATEAAKYEYTLKELDGQLAVYKFGSERPEMVFNVYVAILPELDQTSLKEGINVSDYSMLLRRIEDFIS